MIARFVLGALVIVLPAISATANPSHTDEVEAYVGLTAMAQTVSDRCADILVNNDMLQSAPRFLHITPEDEEDVRFRYSIEMARLAAAIDAAPRLQAWCDTAYREYGPSGYVVKGLLAR